MKGDNNNIPAHLKCGRDVLACNKYLFALLNIKLQILQFDGMIKKMRDCVEEIN